MIKQHLSLVVGLLVLAYLSVMLMSCDSGVDPNGDFASLIDMPNNAVPANFAADQTTSITLYWSNCSQGEGTVSYTLYFGTDDTPEAIADIQADTFYVLSPLESNTAYYWRVEACGESYCKKSPLWTFTTSDKWTYPSYLGQTWHYEYRVTYSNVELSRDDIFYWPDPFIDTIHVAVIDDDIMLDGHPGFVIYQNFSGLGPYGYSYLQNREDGLYYYGTDGGLYFAAPWKPVSAAGADPVQLGSVMAPALGDMLGSNAAQAIMATPYLSLVYPLEKGSDWIVASPEDNDAELKIGKRVISKGQVTVDAGTFDCFVIQRYWDADGDGEWDDNIVSYDYIGCEGLLKRTITHFNATVMEYEGVVGTADVTGDLSLISYYRALPD